MKRRIIIAVSLLVATLIMAFVPSETTLCLAFAGVAFPIPSEVAERVKNSFLNGIKSLDLSDGVYRVFPMFNDAGAPMFENRKAVKSKTLKGSNTALICVQFDKYVNQEHYKTYYKDKQQSVTLSEEGLKQIKASTEALGYFFVKALNRNGRTLISVVDEETAMALIEQQFGFIETEEQLAPQAPQANSEI